MDEGEFWESMSWGPVSVKWTRRSTENPRITLWARDFWTTRENDCCSASSGWLKCHRVMRQRIKELIWAGLSSVGSKPRVMQKEGIRAQRAVQNLVCFHSEVAERKGR